MYDCLHICKYISGIRTEIYSAVTKRLQIAFTFKIETTKYIFILSTLNFSF